MEKGEQPSWTPKEEESLNKFLETGNLAALAGLSSEQIQKAQWLRKTSDKIKTADQPPINPWAKRKGAARLQAAVAEQRGESLNRIKFQLLSRLYGVLASFLPKRK